MSDWAPGDAALCVGFRGSLSWDCSDGPRLWSSSTVVGVVPHPASGLPHLRLKEWPNGWLYDAREFQRQTPHTPDAEDLETIALLNGEPVFETYPQALHNLSNERPNPLGGVGSDFIHSLETSAGGATKHA